MKYFFLVPFGTAKKQGKSRTLDGKCKVPIYASVNSMFHDILKKICGVLSVNTFSSESCAEALVLSKDV